MEIPKFQVGQKVQVNLRRWLSVEDNTHGEWVDTEITHAFDNGEYATTVGIFIEEAIRERPEKEGRDDREKST